jgi:hypothetical protein
MAGLGATSSEWATGTKAYHLSSAAGSKEGESLKIAAHVDGRDSSVRIADVRCLIVVHRPAQLGDQPLPLQRRKPAWQRCKSNARTQSDLWERIKKVVSVCPNRRSLDRAAESREEGEEALARSALHVGLSMLQIVINRSVQARHLCSSGGVDLRAA